MWIEISPCDAKLIAFKSHLPRGRCGLKFEKARKKRGKKGSPSARKVWIEIRGVNEFYITSCVTFREEGVD